ncbi:Uncharacterised protein [Yersinia enterocolitica]|nr:Uncharacterised protein [Yersinia enterocolitica]
MKELRLPSRGYAVIRCHDRVIVAQMNEFPLCNKALLYRDGETFSFRPIKDDEIIGTPSFIMQLLERAGYTIKDPLI